MTVFELQSMISKRHGDSVTDLVLYKDEVQVRNTLSDLAAELGSVDFAPVKADESNELEVLVYYTFAPHHSDCALLLNPPHDLKVEAKMETDAEQKARKAPPAGGIARGSSMHPKSVDCGPMTTDSFRPRLFVLSA